MEPYADVSCVLKVNSQCDACKMKMMEVLSSIIGVYSVTMDSSKGQVKVSGEADPNMLLAALARTGKHAEVVWAKVNHPQVSRTHHGDRYHSGYGRGHYGALEDPYYYPRGYRQRALPDPYDNYHHRPRYPIRGEVSGPDYYYRSGSFDGHDLPPARYVQSYPSQDYNPCEDVQQLMQYNVIP